MIHVIEKSKIREFTDLIAWQEARHLVLAVYRKSQYFPKTEIYGLTSQMQRASVSISSNIAEGFGRQGYKEKIHFYYLAQGSLTELKNQTFIARDLHYFKDKEFEELMKQTAAAHKLLQGLIKKSKSFLNHES